MAKEEQAPRTPQRPVDRDNPEYTIKKCKVYMGYDGLYGYSVALYRDGEKVARCVNDGNGMPTKYRFINKDEKAKFFEFVKTLPKYAPSDLDFECDMTSDLYLGGLVNEQFMREQLAEPCRKYICFRLYEDDLNAFRQYGDGEDLVEHYDAYLEEVRRQYGDSIELIYNEIYGMRGR